MPLSDVSEDDFHPAPVEVSDDEHGSDKRNEKEATPASKPAKKDGEDDDDGIDYGEEVAEAEGEEEEEEEEEEDDEEDEDDEDDDVQTHRRKRRRKDKRAAFFDIEAEVEDEDEAEDDEKEGEEIGDFIEHDDKEDFAEGDQLEDARAYRELDRRHELQQTMDAEELARQLEERHAKRKQFGAGDMAVVPRRLLLPSVEDASIWAVKAREGKEREVVFSIMKRMEERWGTRDELPIMSAFERGGVDSVMRGYIYVEAQRQNDVKLALTDVPNVWPNSKMVLVDIKDMPELLRVNETASLEYGQFVRIDRGKYKGDLAEVIGITENGLEARVKLVPRLDYGVRDETAGPGGARRKRFGGFGATGPKPPQRFFSETEARKRQPRLLQGNPQTNIWRFNGEDFENGFLIKDFQMQHLRSKNVRATLEEARFFSKAGENGSEGLDLNAVAASLRDSVGMANYLPGDMVEVYKGEQTGLVGRASNVRGNIVTVEVTEGDLKGQNFEVPSKSLRKRFRVGEHVKVVGGSVFRDEVGMIVKISEERVTLLTDQTNVEVTVFSRDVREASDIGGQGALGQYALLDLVQLDASTVGCIVKVDRETMLVLDQNGQSKQVTPSQIANKLPKRRTAVAADRNGSEVRLDDVVREYGGQQRQGKVLHMHRSNLFLHCNTTNENAGVFVVRASSVNTVAAKGGRITGTQTGHDLNSMNPALKRKAADGPVAVPKAFGPDRAMNQTVTIKKGSYKGLLGIVKDTTDTHARVELHTKGKILMIPKTDLKFLDKVTGKPIDIGRGRGGFGGTGGPGAFSGPAAAAAAAADFGGSRTPMAANPSRTPARGSTAYSRTPAWGAASGSRTPAYADGSRTVNPYDGNRTSYGGATSYGGSRTPAWQSGSRTPAPDGFGHGNGSKTPAYAGADTWGTGSKTPGYSAPTPGASGDSSWGAYTSGPLDAPTPGAALGAPTPGAFGAPTPGAWQGGWGIDSAATPAATAPTPAATGGYFGAPTPAPYGAPETPAASGPRYTDDD